MTLTRAHLCPSLIPPREGPPPRPWRLIILGGIVVAVVVGAIVLSALEAAGLS